ncbi:S41 family peptidase [Streptomyces clavuligerus]|nr:S41 family peptidase [Streptomyces clavuligerus]WDN56347.1 S41 family peptidase [Streptomyces clavuligerus]
MSGRRARHGVLVAAGTVPARGGTLGTAATPSAPEGRTHLSADGTWQVDGYGTALTISDGVLRTRDTTAISCRPALTVRQSAVTGPDGTVRFAQDGIVTTVSPRTASLSHDSAMSTRRMRRISALPALSGREQPTGPVANLYVFWQTFKENYPFFTERGFDWDAFIERRDLGGESLERYADGAIGSADLPGGIGCLRMSRFVACAPGAYGHATDSPAPPRVLDRIINRARTSGPGARRGLIIDVRGDMGGLDGLALQIANRLTNRPYAAFAEQTRNDARDETRLTPRQTMRVIPAAGSPRCTGPITLLTGGSTVSAGEAFTQAPAERPAPTVRIGENTQGVFSDTLSRSLPNGWESSLSNEKCTTPRGHSFEGPGIPPPLRTPVFTEAESAADHDAVFDRARALLTGRRRPDGDNTGRRTP